jgi:hypothetical protein
MSEKRRLTRFPLAESVSIVLFHSGKEASFEARRVSTETIDVSELGMRIRTKEPIENSLVFDICVELTGDPRRYLLIGESRWCRYNDQQGAFEVGIEIQNGEGTDCEEWRKAISTLSGT